MELEHIQLIIKNYLNLKTKILFEIFYFITKVVYKKHFIKNIVIYKNKI